VTEIATLTVNPTLDLSFETETVVPTEKLRSDHERRDPGGGGINVARMVKVLGGEAIALITVGGSIGRFVTEALKRESVAYRAIWIEDYTRESISVFERSTGKQFRFVLPGPRFHEREWKAVLGQLERMPYEALVASGSLAPGIPNDFYARVAHAAHARNRRVVVDTSGPALAPALAEGIWLYKPNRKELEDFVGHALDDRAAVTDAAREVVASGRAEIVAVSLGVEGAIIVDRRSSAYVPAPHVRTASTIGAGDSFLGALVHGLVRDMGLEHSLRLAVAAGSAKTCLSGNAALTREAVEALMDDMVPAE
jgi:6-phosphofructokinase 2